MTRRRIDGVMAWLWHLLLAALVVVLSSVAWLGIPPWAVPSEYHRVLWAIGASYLAVAIYAVFAANDDSKLAITKLASASVAIFGLAYVVLVAQGGGGVPRGLLAAAAVLSVAAALQFAGSQLRTNQLIGLGIAVLVVVALRVVVRARGGIDADRAAVTVWSMGLASIEVRIHSGLTGPKLGDGGAIAPLGNDFLVVTGHGKFFRLSWDDRNTAFRSDSLALPPPMDRRAYLADQPDTLAESGFRVTDMLLDTTVTPNRIYVSHQAWHSAQKCITLRVSSAEFPSANPPASAPTPWTVEFDSKPCLPPDDTFATIESGGRMAWTDDHALLLTVGDFGYNGIEAPAYAQDTATNYGKVLRRSASGAPWTTFTIGHRNPQGLLVDRSGRVWATEHGPQGGDELNVLVEGGNYGWPLVTYGTQYFSHTWPLSPTATDHGSYVEPAFAFVPSVGLSNLIELRGDEFPPWNGDLMVASLRGKSLFRIRNRDGHVMTVERIRLERRVRDLTQVRDGRLLLWTDEGDLVTISRARNDSTPEAAFRKCSACHEAPDGGVSMGPDLHGVYGRRIASVSGYDYSAAMRQAGGSWTAARLDAFLKDPSAAIPGTRMSANGIADSTERQKVIEYLRQYR